ncbi:protein of unknown function [Caballeronia sp. S22]
MMTATLEASLSFIRYVTPHFRLARDVSNKTVVYAEVSPECRRSEWRLLGASNVAALN